MKKHENIKNKLKITGFVILAAGIILTATGFISMFKSAFDGEGMSKLFFLSFIGVPLLGIGGAILGFAYQREVMNYTKNESIPVIKDVVKETVATMNDSLSKGTSERDKTDTVCECGQVNKSDDNYCPKCGRSLRKTCEFCGKDIDSKAKYCPHCGKPVK